MLGALFTKLAYDVDAVRCLVDDLRRSLERTAHVLPINPTRDVPVFVVEVQILSHSPYVESIRPPRWCNGCAYERSAQASSVLPTNSLITTPVPLLQCPVWCNPEDAESIGALRCNIGRATEVAAKVLAVGSLRLPASSIEIPVATCHVNAAADIVNPAR
jgi:hypothetical protein